MTFIPLEPLSTARALVRKVISATGFSLAASLGLISAEALAEFRVAPPLNSIPQSDDYRVWVADSRNGDYRASHVSITEDQYSSKASNWGYNPFVKDFRFSFTNFEFRDEGVWVKIAMPGKDIPDLAVRPTRKGATVFYETDDSGKRIAKIRLKAPSNDYLKNQYLSVVPINSDGSHNRAVALGVFANSYTPVPTRNLVVVRPGDNMPNANTLSAGQTVVFKRGEHQLGRDYKLKNGVDYYFENGAHMYGFFERRGSYDDVRLYGYGIIDHKFLPRYQNGEKLKQNPILFVNSSNVSIEDITIVDSSHHTIIVGDGRDGKNFIKKFKAVTWRANGDGIHVSGTANVSDAFLRTQDDSMYVASYMDGVVQERIATWNDFNGTSFLFTAGGSGGNTVLRDSDVMYARSRFNPDDKSASKHNNWAGHTGGSIFNLRSQFADAEIYDVDIDNVHVDDHRVDKRIFDLGMRKANGALTTDASFRNISFKNITAVDSGKYPQRFLGYSDAIYPENIRFECVEIEGEVLRNLDGWIKSNLKNSEISIKGCGDARPTPTPEPSSEPTPLPTSEPTPEPTPEATPEPTSEPTPISTPEPTPDPSGSEELSNGDFKAGDEFWNYWKPDTTRIKPCGKGGDNAMQASSGGIGGAYQPVQLRPDRKYRLTATARVNAPEKTGTVGVHFKEFGDKEPLQEALIEFNSKRFEQKSIDFYLDSNLEYDTSFVFLYKTNNGTNFCVDDISLSEVD